MSRSVLRSFMWCAALAAVLFAVLAAVSNQAVGWLWIVCGVCAFASAFTGLMFAMIKVPR